MARFIYRLQSVLNLKVQMERQARMEFGQATMVLRAEEEKLDEFIGRREAYIEEGRQLRNSGLNIRDLKENESSVKLMDEKIIGQRERVKLAERAVERARTKLTEAIQERKAQERLRERAFEEYLEEEKHNEAKEIDELVSFRYGAGEVTANGNG